MSEKETPLVPATTGWHTGRSWKDHPIEDACPCKQEACGLVDLDSASPECTEHGLSSPKSMRQSHPAHLCPAA